MRVLPPGREQAPWSSDTRESGCATAKHGINAAKHVFRSILLTQRRRWRGSKPRRLLQEKFTLSNLFIDCIPAPAGICFDEGMWPRKRLKSILLHSWVFKADGLDTSISLSHFSVYVFCAYLLYWLAWEMAELQLWLCRSDFTNSEDLSTLVPGFCKLAFFPERFSMIQLLAQLVSKAESILVMKNELAFIDRYLSSHSSHHNAPKSNLFIQTDWKLDPDRLHQKVCCHQELKTNLMEYETEF